MKVNNNMAKNEKGAVSLFVVIFATLLITIITISFARLMTSDQQQATAADLSQSAYDSAQSGVEDAKRALLNYTTLCSSGDPKCGTVQGHIDSPNCNTSVSDLVTPQNGEVLIAQNANDNALNQAYTCVTITRNTNDYLGQLQANASKLIPLTSVTPFNQVLIEWYSLSDTQNPAAVDVKPLSYGAPLLPQSAWTVDRPSIMRTQFMQIGSNFKLTDFDDESGNSNANTLFLYPIGNKGMANTAIDSNNTLAISSYDTRKTPTGHPLPINCSGNVSAGGYACRALLTLPNPIGGSTSSDRVAAFLRLTSIYNKTNFRVSLLQSGAPVQFNNVQPQIDSTGRAGDMFRRVQSRVEFGDPNYPYPNAAIQTTGSFCKNFLITDNPNDYSNSCTP